MHKSSIGKEKGKNEDSCGRGGRFLIVLILLIFVGSVCLCIGLWRPSDKRLVEVVSDGEVLYTIDLTKAEDAEFTVYSPDNRKNTVLIQNGSICVKEAECPDQICVKTGKLLSESMPIVCLPNRLIIRFAE